LRKKDNPPAAPLVGTAIARRVALFPQPNDGTRTVSAPPLFHIVLVQPEIPQNAGNIGRTCVALGAKLWLVRPLGFRLDQRQLRRAGLDYWQHLDWEAVDDWTALCQRMPGASPWLFTKTARQTYTAAAFRPGDLLVFGSETQGLPASLLQSNAERCLRIPMRPEARSLNLACSVALAAYEAARQVGGLP
jgi:tRNA (cytidine/uridine-2'-O-)-methyltransferase